jgi:hypothetical protein
MASALANVADDVMRDRLENVMNVMAVLPNDGLIVLRRMWLRDASCEKRHLRERSL